MADCYLQFSEVLPHLTDEEQAWLQHQLAPVCVFDGREYSMEELSGSRDVDSAVWRGCRVFRDLELEGADNDGEAGFEYAFSEDIDWGRHLWFHADEWGCLKRLAHLVQKFLAAFRSGRFWSLTYAATCSKSLIGAFGGGAVFITADEVIWSDSHDFAQQHAATAREHGLRDARLIIPDESSTG